MGIAPGFNVCASAWNEINDSLKKTFSVIWSVDLGVYDDILAWPSPVLACPALVHDQRSVARVVVVVEIEEEPEVLPFLGILSSSSTSFCNKIATFMVDVNNSRSNMEILNTVDVETAGRDYESVYDLYSQLNSLTPIFRLPTETLQAILILLARDFHDQSYGNPCSAVPHWVNVSYVCRRWRSIALNCSTLWTYLFTLSPRWTEVLLARSKQASLKVKVDFRMKKKSRALRFLKQVVKHAERIQALHISLPTYGSVDLSVLSSRAPCLTSLKIFWTCCLSESGWPSILFDGDTPMLRMLHLACCPTPWYLLEVTGLTSLSLYGVPGRFRQNMVDFLATLRSMHHFTHLSLYDALSSAANFLSSAAVKTFQKIHLPHLSRFRVNAPITTVITLLHCLNIPLKTLVRLRCTSERGLSLNDYAPLLPLLAQRFDTSGSQALSSPIIRSLCITFGRALAVLNFSVTECGCNLGLWDHNVPLQITIEFDEPISVDGSSSRDSFIGDICYSLPLPDVRHLCVWAPPLSSAFWKRTLGRLQDIQYLKLEYGCMPDLTPLLSTGGGNSENHTECTSPGLDRECIPALETLQLCSIDFSPPNQVNPSVAYLTDVRSLYNALSRRKESQGLLIMSECIVADDMELNMVGRWKDGHFYVVKESIEPYRNAQSDPADSEESEESEDTESTSDEDN